MEFKNKIKKHSNDFLCFFFHFLFYKYIEKFWKQSMQDSKNIFSEESLVLFLNESFKDCLREFVIKCLVKLLMKFPINISESSLKNPRNFFNESSEDFLRQCIKKNL